MLDNSKEKKSYQKHRVINIRRLRTELRDVGCDSNGSWENVGRNWYQKRKNRHVPN